MRNSIIKSIEEWDTEYSKYLDEKMKKVVPNLKAITQWLYEDGYYGPSYRDLDEEEIGCVEYDNLRQECLDKLSIAIDAIEDYVVEDEDWFDEEGNELDDPIRYEVGRFDKFDIAKDRFWHIVEIYGSLP